MLILTHQRWLPIYTTGPDGTAEGLNNIAVLETDSIILVPARVISEYQVNALCEMDDLNPGEKSVQVNT